MAGIIKQKYALAPVDDLTPHPQNARHGAVGKIEESVSATGFYGTLVAQKSTGHVLVGNHRLLVLQQHGVKKVPVMWVDVDDDDALRILVNDNKVSEHADWDERGLAELLQDAGLEGMVVSEGEFEDMLRESGMLGDAAAGWLDEDDEIKGDEEPGEGDPADRPDIRPDDNGRGPAAPDAQYVGMSWTVTVEQRDVINTALRKAKANAGCQTFADALVEVCRSYEGGTK